MLTEKQIIEKGFEAIVDNLYRKKGNLYVQHHGELKLASFIDEDELKTITDYDVYLREKNKASPEDEKKPVAKTIKTEKTEVETKGSDKFGWPSSITKKTSLVESKQGKLRGTEKDIIRLMDTKLQLDSIIEASEDKKKLGEGLLWHELVFGKGARQAIHVEPSAELVDMITQDMGGIVTEMVDFGTNVIEDPNTNEKYSTYYCVVKATDTITGTTGLGAAEQIIDFDEIKNNNRTFARTLVIRKSERNAKERIIPIPRKAMVNLIRKKLEEHYKK